MMVISNYQKILLKKLYLFWVRSPTSIACGMDIEMSNEGKGGMTSTTSNPIGS